jgi:hypothetical protein
VPASIELSGQPEEAATNEANAANASGLRMGRL